MRLDNFIKRPVLSTVISVFIVILGIIGLATLPITQYPSIAPPTVMVSATYPGANAQTVLNSVIVPLEEQINGVENMLYMSSSATNNGSASISIYFKQGTDPDMAAVNVQNRVSMAQGLLPAEVTQIGVMTMKRQSSMLMIFSLVDTSDKYPYDFIENYAEINIIPEVKRVNGVGQAFVMGADYSMRIWLKPDVMSQYKLMPSDITRVLAEQNLEAAPGQFGERSNQTFQYTIRYRGRLQTEEEFGNIVVKSMPDGRVLHLKDVADIELGRLTYSFINKVNGHNGVTCIVFQLAGSNATSTINTLEKQLDEANENLPAGLKINIAHSANDFLFASIHEVVKTLIEAFILVFIVVYIFLQDFRSTLIPAIAIPVSLIGTFFILKMMGFSLNLLTLSALVLAIAIVVDDAIVVVEGVHAKLDQGYHSSLEASIDAMSELGTAIVSITLVMMAVFIPVSFMGGTAGTFYRQFGLTMAVAIGISALNALTLSPALCAVFLKPKNKDGVDKKSTFVDRFHTAFHTTYNKILGKYRRKIVKLIKNKRLVYILVPAAIVVLIVLMKTTPTGMIPSEDQGVIMGAITLPPGTSQDRAEQIFMQVDSLVASESCVDSHTIISGYGFTGGQGPSYGSVIIKLKPWNERSQMQSVDVIYIELFMRAQKIIKDARVLFFMPPSIPGYSVSSSVELNLQDKTGGTLDRFYDVSQSFIKDLMARPEIQTAQTTFNPKFPQYQIDIDAAACKKAGISPSTILSVLQGYYGGLYASNFNRFGKMYRVMVQAHPKDRKNIESLKNIMVRNGVEMAPVTQFMTMKKVYGPDNIDRFNLYTSMRILVNPAEGYTSGQALEAIAEVSKQNLPVGYGYELGGMAREEATNGSSTGLIFVLCLVFVYLLLSALYESYILPLSVIFSIPFGLAGSFIFVNLYGLLTKIPMLQMLLGSMSNDIYMQIALIMLIGLLGKNAILIVEFALDRRRQGVGIGWSAVLGASARLRPILMTSLAMVVGLFPLMIATGAGAHGYRTLGWAAVGGMAIGMIFQIFVVPVLFSIFEYLQEKVKPIKWDIEEEKTVNPEIQQYVKD